MKRGMRLCWLGGMLCMLGLSNATTASAGNVSAPAKHKAWHPENPDKLWLLIHDDCAPAAARGVQPPAPCTEVDAPRADRNGYVVFKDRDGKYQYLVLPLARITGIESPALLAPDAPDYFADAWTARLYVEAALHRRQPRDVLSLVVNSVRGRTQNQLHIHVDCVRSDVHAALQRMLPTITGTWHPLDEPLPPNGHRYQAMWLGGKTLTENPFKLLAAALPSGDEMGRHSLIVVGAHSPAGKPGFILLSGRADPAGHDRGSGDELQDQDCVLATRSRALE
jgi:CDP-diacylglycerol pyrophosphatase